MPYINVRIGKKITQKQEQTLAESLGKLITMIPEKTYEKTMVHIDQDCVIYRGGKRTECAYLETRLYKTYDPQLKIQYTLEIFKILEQVLGISDNQIYMNMLELSNWGSKGQMLLSELEE